VLWHEPATTAVATRTARCRIACDRPSDQEGYLRFQAGPSWFPLIIWIFVCSEERADFRIWAGVIGFKLLALVGVNLIVAGLTSLRLSEPDLVLLLYVGASH
jgi:hypothetical protein